MTDRNDFVERLLKMVKEVTPSFTQEQADKVEQAIRREWGGDSPFIAKRAPMLRASRVKVRADIGLKSVDQLHKEHGVSRKTIYNWINKKNQSD